MPISTYLNRLKERTETYFRQVSNYNYTVEVNFLTESEDLANDAANVYELSGMLIPDPGMGPNFVMQPALFQELFQRVDARYNFDNYDQNDDGVVDFLALIVIRFAPGKANGTTGLPGCDINNYWIQTNDNWVINGQIMGTMRVNGLGSQLPCKSIQQRKFNGDPVDLTLSIFTHELGHALFSFTDITSGWTVPTGDDALGDFCNMSKSINFGNRPSMYNPVLRVQSGWLNPTTLTSGDKTFSDLLRTNSIYSYVFPSGNSITESGQAFYITYHDKSLGSYFEEKWPIPTDYSLNSRGIMIWSHIASISQWTYWEWYHKPIDIIAAHGKWKWDLSDTVRRDPALNQYVTASNLYSPDPAKGMDSLEARYAYVKLRWNGSAWLEEGIYQDKRRGSASCFFDPLNPKEFSFYSNPNSNWYLNSTTENYSKTVASNFKMTNLRVEGSSTKANFLIGASANIISQNSTLVRGHWYFDQDVTINYGVTLTIEAGAKLYFAAGKALVVNGTLNALGNSSNHITFDWMGSPAYWVDIRFNNGSSGNLQYCNIYNATNGISLYNSSPQIKYSTIDSCNTGIYCDYYSSPVLVGNNIRFNTSYGVRCNSFSSPNMTDNGYPGSNVIRNNYTGINTTYFCNPNLNGYMTYGNSIFDNTGDEVSALYNCSISAQRVYWGSSPTYYAYQSTIDCSNPLPDNPNPGRSVVSTPEDKISSTNGISLSIQADDLSSALDKQKDKKYDEAIPLFLEVFKSNKDALVGKFALIKIEECFTQAGKKDFLEYSKKELKPIIKTATETFVVLLELETHQLVNAKSYKEAMDNLFLIKEKYNLNEDIDKNTLYRIGVFYSDLYGDKKNAQKYFDELKAKYPTDDLVNDIDRWLNAASGESKNGSYIAIAQTGGDASASEEASISVENYPNPFNPTTRISFTIPQKGNVKLRVFDLLGREITILADGVYEAGKYEVSFDASSLPSGVYFYNLTTGSNTITKKMLLIK